MSVSPRLAEHIHQLAGRHAVLIIRSHIIVSCKAAVLILSPGNHKICTSEAPAHAEMVSWRMGSGTRSALFLAAARMQSGIMRSFAKSPPPITFSGTCGGDGRLTVRKEGATVTVRHQLRNRICCWNRGVKSRPAHPSPCIPTPTHGYDTLYLS